MTLIGYLTRTLFADGAIDDALPEEASRLGRALALIDPEPGAAETMARVVDALPRVRLAHFCVDCGAPRRSDVLSVLGALDRAEASTIIAIGGAGAIGRRVWRRRPPSDAVRPARSSPFRSACSTSGWDARCACATVSPSSVRVRIG